MIGTARTARSFDCDVLVAGGGPVGLLTGYLCGLAGLDVRIVEARDELPQDLRATSFHPATLDMLEPHGFTAELRDHAIVCASWQVRLHPSGERAVFDLSSIANDTRHPFRLQTPQWRLARAVAARIGREHTVAFDMSSGLVDFVADDSGVTATVRHNGIDETTRSRILVGADGLRSIVRERLGLAFDGETFPETTVVVTTSFRFQEHMEGLTPVTSCWTPDGHLAFLQLPEFWRLALYPDESMPLEPQMTPQAIEAALQAIVPQPRPFDILKIWPYRVQQRIVPTYRVGRVVLAGDAAHVNSPAGGMGLNAGIHDAFELAAALKAILKDGTALERLDLYDRRRRPIMQREVLEQAARNRDRMRETDPQRRRALLANLQAITRDPERMRAYVLKASMISGLREAAAIG